MNNVSLIGNIANDIDLKVTPQGHHVAKFSLAVNNPYNRDKTSFIPVEVWRKQAENVSSFCSKGSKIGVVGYIEVDSYEKDGQRRTFTKIIANSVEFLTPKSNRSEQPNSSYQAPTQQQQHSQPANDPFNTVPDPNYDDSDLPF